MNWSVPGASVPATALLVCALGALGCSVAEGHSRPVPDRQRDAGASDATVRTAKPHPPLRAIPPWERTNAGSDEIGLTAGELEKRLGAPTEKHSDSWVYRRRPSCGVDFILTDTYVFHDRRVAKVRHESRRTNAECFERY